MGQGTKRSTSKKNASRPDGGTDSLLTAGDLARLLEVDLKTIHNWVKQGHVFAYRTEGRHLRFQRVQVVRFLRHLGRTVPSEIGRKPPRVLIHQGQERKSRVSLGLAGTVKDGLFSVALEVAAGSYEVLVLELDTHSASLTCSLVGALRERPTTRALALVGMSRDPTVRHEFLACGGDVALPSPTTAVAGTVRWLTGAAHDLPRGAVTMDAARRR